MEAKIKYLREKEVARLTGIALPTLRNHRHLGKGIPYIKIGKSIRYSWKVFLNYYNEHQKGSYKWNEKELIVSCNRTESLDASHREIMDQSIVLPKECGMTRIFADHLHNVAKKLEENEETGSKRYVYVRLGSDHFRHAFNYEVIAWGTLARRLFPEFDEYNLM